MRTAQMPPTPRQGWVDSSRRSAPVERIVAVRAYVVAPDASSLGADDADASPELLDWRRQKIATPLSIYEEFRESRRGAIGRDSWTTVLVEVESSSGVIGVGLTHGGVAAAAIVELHLADLVEGEDARSHDRIWHRMYSSTLVYGRKGIVLHAISAVDLAVWDLHGKLDSTPVYSLLGSRRSPRVELYGTGPDAGAIHRLGLRGAKLPLTWAPVEGDVGFLRNVDRAKAAREAAGADLPLMYDCWMSLDVDYATRLGEALAPIGFAWLEEPLPPDDYRGYAELRRRLTPDIRIAAGEHEYTAEGHRLLCEAGVDILQPDPVMCGGMTEMLRIADTARAYRKQVIPHVGGIYSFHFMAGYEEATLTEMPVTRGRCDSLSPTFQGVLEGEPTPVDGVVTLSEAPGFGVAIDPKARLHRPATREMLENFR